MGRKRNKKEGHGFLPWWHRNKWRAFEVAIYVAVILALVMIYAIFSWSREIHWRDAAYRADYDALSAAGDFAAGTLGTIVAAISVFALFRTFAYQRKVTVATMQQTEMQRFNDLYFNLLGLYNRLVESLGTSEEALLIDKFHYLSRAAGLQGYPVAEQPQRTGKMYIHYMRKCITSRFGRCDKVDEGQRNGVELFREYYNMNPGQLGAYYRTIYRLLELLDQGKIPEEEKSSYSKILRAQFTESELFLLYYNSRTRLGAKMLYYLRKYHMLKHLPPLALLELKQYAKGLSADEKNELNTFYELLYGTICELTDWGGNIIKEKAQKGNGFYEIECEVVGFRQKKMPGNEINIEIEIKRDAFVKLKDYSTLKGWDISKWEQLAKDFLFVMLPIARFSHARCNLKVRTPRKEFIFFFWDSKFNK